MKPKEPQSQPPFDVAKLTTVLHKHEDLLLKIPGVTGCGIGLAELGKGDRIVIQVFVQSETLVKNVQKLATELIQGFPVETIAMPVLDAGQDQLMKGE